MTEPETFRTGQRVWVAHETRMLPGEVVRVMRDGIYRVLLVGGSLPITLPGVCLRSSPEREKVGKT